MPAVNPEILVWARETAGLTLQDAAAKVGIRDARGVAAVDRLAALERGAGEPIRPVLVRNAVDDQDGQNPRRQARAGRQDASPRKGAVAGDDACSTCIDANVIIDAQAPGEDPVGTAPLGRVTVQSDSAWVARWSTMYWRSSAIWLRVSAV